MDEVCSSFDFRKNRQRVKYRSGHKTEISTDERGLIEQGVKLGARHESGD